MFVKEIWIHANSLTSVYISYQKTTAILKFAFSRYFQLNIGDFTIDRFRLLYLEKKLYNWRVNMKKRNVSNLSLRIGILRQPNNIIWCYLRWCNFTFQTLTSVSE